MFRTTLLIIIFLFIRPKLHAQIRDENIDRYEYGLSTGYAYTKTSFIQLGIFRGRHIGAFHSPSNLYGIGADLGLNFRDWIIAPKAFIEFNPLTALPFRLTLINYIRAGQSDLRLVPEVGLGNMVSFCYGYSIPLGKQQFESVSRNRLALNISLPLHH